MKPQTFQSGWEQGRGAHEPLVAVAVAADDQAVVETLHKTASHGTLDPTDGLVRKYFPKKDIKEIPDEISPALTNFMYIAAVVNALEIGFVCQFPEHKQKPWIAVFNCIMAAIFCMEVVLKWRKVGVRAYFTHPLTRVWNWIDFSATLSSAGDLIQTFLIAAHVMHLGQDVAILSALGVLRVIRIFRLLRYLETIPALAITVGGIAGSMEPLVWTVIALVMVIYVFAIIFVIAAGNVDDENFGVLSSAMLSMTDIVVFAEWRDIIPDDKFAWMIGPFFVFVLISAFGITNIIIGVIVDATALTRVKLEWSEKRERLKEMGDVWEEKIFDAGLRREDMEHLGEEERSQKLRERFRVIEEILGDILADPHFGFPAGLTAHELRMVIDKNGDGKVNHDDFVLGLGRLLLSDPFQAEVLHSVNLAINRQDLGKIKTAVCEMSTRIDQMQEHMQQSAQAIQELKRMVQDISRKG